jgi:hypothetical protein
MSMRRAGVALLLAGAMVVGATGIASAAPAAPKPKHPIHVYTKAPSCRAGLHLLRAQRGTFDSRYDHILVKGIIGTACAHGGTAARKGSVCSIAQHMFGLFDPLFKTDADRDRGRQIVAAACSV